MLKRLVSWALLLAALLWVPFLLATVFDLDRRWQVPAAVAFLPYALVLTAVVAVVAAVARRWLAVAVAVLGLLVLGVPRADRVVADDQPAARGPQLVVATSNIFVGNGDFRRLAELVRRERVDVLAVQENTPGSDEELARIGLRRQLPGGASTPDERPGAAGLALFTREPLAVQPPPRGDHRSLGGVVSVRGARGDGVVVRSVHPPPPFSNANLRCWKRCTRAYASLLGREGTAPGGRAVILAGDFNATLDHHPLGSLIDAGYRDAAEQTGDGWRTTWTARRGLQRLTLDHILVSRGVAVEEVTVHPLGSTDHHVVIARLRLPAS